MFDLPSMLGEYLLPLLILVPLAIVLVLLAARQNKDEEPWQKRSAETAPPPPWTPPRPASAPRPDVELPTAPQPGLVESETVTSPVPFAVAVEIPAPSPVAPPAPRPAGGETPLPLLVVDDSAVVRAKLSKLLSGAGYAVTLARHGHEAIEQLNQHWFALMITDLEMPEMDGFELIAQVSNDLKTEDLPIVAITGHEALQAKVQDARGLYGIFKKPWNDRELLQRVGVLAQLRPRA